VKLPLCVVLLAGATLAAQDTSETWLRWSAAQAQTIGKAAYVQGRVGGIFDTRILKTERSYNYKLAATWMTRDVIWATARTLQLTGRLTDDETRALIADAQQPNHTVVIVEIDPREGSGVIPNDWSAFLQAHVPEGVAPRAVRGQDTPRLREVKALAGVLRRNYDYDRFWMVFPLTHADGKPLFSSSDTQAELVVRITDREGRVRWPIPPSIR
jgi:hypothetical protein